MNTDSLPIFKAVPPAAPAPQGLPVLRLGFRPFYIGGTLLAALALPLWLAMFFGQTAWTPNLPPLLWHAHEMLFGFAVAIIVGFLLTAAKAWTGLATPRGPALAALVLLWLAARVAALVGPYALYAALDLALLPLVALILVRILLKARNHRNLPLGLLVLLLALANLLFHLAVMGVLALPAVTPLYAALALITLIECVMGGRVIPSFTMAVTRGLKLAAKPVLERFVLGATGLGLLLWLLAAPALLGGTLLALASSLQVWRMRGWHPVVTRKRPILWILHLAYAWIPVGLALLALAQFGLVSTSAGVHALAVGATGGLIIGMVTRTARGHTGRPLQVSKPEVLAYALVMAAALLRVLLPLLLPSLYLVWLVVAGMAWSAAFLIYLWIYTPWLARTRLDGKDG
jgi:uncharacterized protein involved in response to NO